MVGTLVLVRHGECTWNVQELFPGWYDSPLTDLGNKQALSAGELIRNYGVIIGRAHSSVLTRAVQTCEIILKQSDQECVPIYKHWRLNERHFGALTGLNKNDIISEFGEEQVKIWRKSFKCPPPAMDCKHKYFKDIVYDPRYESDPPKIGFPLRESIEATSERVKAYWNTNILNDLKDRHNLLVVAHTSSIAAIIRILDNLSDDETSQIELLNGVPMVYELNENFQPKEPIKILGDQHTIAKAYEGLPKSMRGKKYCYGPKMISGLTCD